MSQPGHLSTQYSLLHQERLKRHAYEDTPKAAWGRRIDETDQINPTSWNFAVTMSLSNGFMMYSLAPACSARAICATSFSVVQNTTLGTSPPGMRRRLPRNS